MKVRDIPISLVFLWVSSPLWSQLSVNISDYELILIQFCQNAYHVRNLLFETFQIVKGHLYTLWIGSFLYFSKVAPEGLCKVYLGIWQGAVCVSCTEVVPNLDSIIFHWRNFMLFICKWEGHYQQTHCWDKDRNRPLWDLDHIKDLLVTARYWHGITPNSQMSFMRLKVETRTIRCQSLWNTIFNTFLTLFSL